MGADLPTTVSFVDTVIWQQVGDEIVLLDLRAGDYHGLNDVGSRMWKALVDDPHVPTAHARLSETYEVDEQTLRDDLDDFVKRLVALGLLATP